LTNSSGPGVGERTIEPPFSVRGESSRQNGPSRFAVVSVAPLLAVVEQAHQVDTPSEPDASTASLWNELELWPIELMMAQAWWNSSSDSFTSRTKAMQVLDQRRHHLAEARIGRARDLGQHRLGDVIRSLDDHGSLPLYCAAVFLAELICLPARLLNPPGTLPANCRE
jgi:hypothetical protein